MVSLNLNVKNVIHLDSFANITVDHLAICFLLIDNCFFPFKYLNQMEAH